MEACLIEKYAASAPRYTSFPTAPHFHAGVDADIYRGWLRELSPDSSISLYIHIPFCESLCWFCGCHTKATRSYAPVAAYLRRLQDEIALLGASLPQGCTVRRIHWGGGSPTILSAEDISALATVLHNAFDIASDAEFSVEIDPRDLSHERIEALVSTGMTRASVGIQDFNPKVQQAINREQSFAVTKAVIDSFRMAGIASINVDLLYGLPHQSTRLLVKTLVNVLELLPDRIALFGYAHVPWMKRHQALIEESALPDAAARFRGSQLASDIVTAWGYERIGIDHFALPHDPLAIAARGGRLRRNFQGYTDDSCDVLLGLGASAVGRLPQGYVQNAVPVDEYSRGVAAGRLPVTRGVALGEEDRVRAYAIERLMCEFRLSGAEMRQRFGAEATKVIAEAEAIATEGGDAVLVKDGQTFRVTERGRPFVRSICARLDPYFAVGSARHSLAV
jgi:oxygen-independent coproporphyrinogen-3 oxidase